MPLFDFRCPAGHTTESLVSHKVHSVRCDICGEDAEKVILSAPKVSWLEMGAQRSAGPEAIARFDRMHRQQKAKEEKCMRDNGDYGQRF